MASNLSKGSNSYPHVSGMYSNVSHNSTLPVNYSSHTTHNYSNPNLAPISTSPIRPSSPSNVNLPRTPSSFVEVEKLR